MDDIIEDGVTGWRDPTAQDWAEKWEYIVDLWVNQDYTMNQIMAECRFNGSRQRLLKRLRKVNLLKNNKEPEIATIIRKTRQRKKAGKATLAKVGRKLIDSNEVDRYVTRAGRTMDELEAKAPPTTPPGVVCYTPPLTMNGSEHSSKSISSSGPSFVPMDLFTPFRLPRKSTSVSPVTTSSPVFASFWNIFTIPDYPNTPAHAVEKFFYFAPFSPALAHNPDHRCCRKHHFGERSRHFQDYMELPLDKVLSSLLNPSAAIHNPAHQCCRKFENYRDWL